MFVSFGQWEPSIHETVDQIKRIVNAKALSASDVQIDIANSKAVISGRSEEPYLVTLDSCTCFDFASRNLPCKHVYRLAFELGFLEDLPTLNKKAAKSFDFDAEISRFYTAYLSGVISAEKFVKIADAISKGK